MTADELDDIARRVASRLGRAGGWPELLTAAEVASRYRVARSWVYAHAPELGAIRLGDGPRPRLRFDPAIVEQVLNPRPLAAAPTAALLPIRNGRRRRVRDEQRRPRP